MSLVICSSKSARNPILEPAAMPHPGVGTFQKTPADFGLQLVETVDANEADMKKLA